MVGRYVYIRDCYCDALGFKKNKPYLVIEEHPMSGYYRLRNTLEQTVGNKHESFLIYRDWCCIYNITIEMPPDELFEI